MNNKKNDLSEYILKCRNNDCEENTEHVCCLSCDSYKRCVSKDWACIYLDNNDSPENCEELCLEKNE